MRQVIGWSTIIAIFMLLFGCQSQGPNMMTATPTETRLEVVQVGSLEEVEAIEKAGAAQRRAMAKARGYDELETQVFTDMADLRAYLLPYKKAAVNGYALRHDDEICRVWVRVGSDYERNLGRSVKECMALE